MGTLKVQIEQERLARLVGMAARPVRANPAQPVEAALYLAASEAHGLVLTGAGRGLTVVASEPVCEVKGEGVACFAAATLAGAVALMPKDGLVTLAQPHKSLLVSCGSQEYRLPTLDPATYLQPQGTGEIPDAEALVIPGAWWVKAIPLVCSGAADLKGNPSLQLVQAVYKAGVFTLRATDGFHAACVSLKLPGGREGEALLPAASLREAARVAVDADTDVVKWGWESGARVRLEMEPSVALLLQTGATKFPPVDRLRGFPTTTTVTVDVKAFGLAFRAVSLMTTTLAKPRARLVTGVDELLLTSTDQQAGRAMHRVEATIEGEYVDMLVNVGYLADGLAGVTGRATLSFSGPARPVILTGTRDLKEDDPIEWDWWYAVAPMYLPAAGDPERVVVGTGEAAKLVAATSFED